jgi:hypothetical protein
LRRSIWGGRQRNEYWNNFTPASLISGTIALLFFAYNSLQSTATAVPAAVALALSTTPLLPFLPPGLPFFLLYRYVWKKGRLNRAERDILRLPLRYLDGQSLHADKKVSLPDGGSYSVQIFDTRESALAVMDERKIRSTTLLEAKDDPSRRFFVFSAENDDPMAERILIPGHPLELAELCVRKARTYEWLSVGAFALGYAMNLICALILFGLWIVR